MRGLLQDIYEAELRRDRGAFFGSILGTLNHVLWGDTIWMSRFDPSVEAPGLSIPESPDMASDLAEWSLMRFRLDGKISHWANSLRAVDLAGTLTWYSGAAGTDVSRPLSLCITHFFNHQTHHRGQVHAMLTAAGSKAPVSDLVFMPEG